MATGICFNKSIDRTLLSFIVIFFCNISASTNIAIVVAVAVCSFSLLPVVQFVGLPQSTIRIPEHVISMVTACSTPRGYNVHCSIIFAWHGSNNILFFISTMMDAAASLISLAKSRCISSSSVSAFQTCSSAALLAQNIDLLSISKTHIGCNSIFIQRKSFRV